MYRLCLAAAIAAIAFPAFAQAPKAQNQPNAATRDFVQKAAVGDMYEVQASKMALDKAQNDEFKRFAQRIVDDHTKASDELKSLVGNMQGIQVPNSLDDKHKGMIDQLRSASGARFDQLYRTQQISAHEEAIRLFEGYARNGENAQLKQFAEKTLPALREHRQMAQNLPQGRDAPAVGQAPRQQGNQAQRQGQRNVIDRPSPDHVLASDLRGTTVVSTNNENIGDIDDIVLNRRGEPVALVVGVGGFLGVGEKKVAIPFNAFEITAARATTGEAPRTGTQSDRQQNTQRDRQAQDRTAPMNPERVVLRGMSKQDLEAAPSFDRNGRNR
jgi:predicted outer membrane protein